MCTLRAIAFTFWLAASPTLAAGPRDSETTVVDPNPPSCIQRNVDSISAAFDRVFPADPQDAVPVAITGGKTERHASPPQPQPKPPHINFNVGDTIREPTLAEEIAAAADTSTRETLDAPNIKAQIEADRAATPPRDSPPPVAVGEGDVSGVYVQSRRGTAPPVARDQVAPRLRLSTEPGMGSPGAAEQARKARSRLEFTVNDSRPLGGKNLTPRIRESTIATIDRYIADIRLDGRVAAESEELIRRARLKQNILRSADKGSEIDGTLTTRLPRGTGGQRNHTTREAEPHLFEQPKVTVKPGEQPEPFVMNTEGGGTYQPYSVSDPLPGSMNDVHFAGEGLSPPRIRATQLAEIGPDGHPVFEFDLPPEGKLPEFKPFNPNDVVIPTDSAEVRLAAELEPGESATFFRSGGENLVYITHPPVPESVIAEGKAAFAEEKHRYRLKHGRSMTEAPGMEAGYIKKARLKWAQEHNFRVVKIEKTIPATREEIARYVARVKRRWYQEQLFDYFASRARFRGKAFMSRPQSFDPGAIYRGVTVQPFVRGHTIKEVDGLLLEYYTAACQKSALCKERITKRFARLGLNTPEEEALRIAAIEQFYRESYPYVMKFNAASNPPELRYANSSRLMNYKYVRSNSEHLDLETYFGLACDEACKRKIREHFKSEGFPTPEEVKKYVDDIEKNYPGFFTQADPTTHPQHPDNAVEVGFDFNHGRNGFTNGVTIDL